MADKSIKMLIETCATYSTSYLSISMLSGFWILIFLTKYGEKNLLSVEFSVKLTSIGLCTG